MSILDRIKQNIKSHDYKNQREDYFDNGMEVALMNGFTKAAQNAFIKDLVKKAVDTAKPKKVMPGRKIVGYRYTNPNEIGGYSKQFTKDGELYGTMSPEMFEKITKQYNSGENPTICGRTFHPEGWESYPQSTNLTPAQYEKMFKKGLIVDPDKNLETYHSNGVNSLTPKQTASEASAELEKAIMTIPENIQDAYLYGQRNLDDYSAQRPKGDMNFIYEGSSKYREGDKNLPLGWKEHVIDIGKGQELEPFVNDMLHEGGHRTDAGRLGVNNYSVEGNLGKYLRKDIADRIAESEDPGKMIDEISGGNKAIVRLLSDAVGLHPEAKHPEKLRYRHPKNYASDWKKIYDKKLPAELLRRDEKIENSTMSSEAYAEIMGILGTPGGYEWMQKNAPGTLRRFERISSIIKMKAEQALGPDGKVPNMYKVEFNPELRY